jgi:hypothetical protein
MDELTAPSGSTGGRNDDFKKIKGIGDSIAKALVESGICRFRELAGLTPLELTELLKDRVAFISPQRIQRDDWIGQAKNLGDQAQPDPMGSEKPPEKGSAYHPQEAEKANTDAKRETWKEVADFFVSFGYTAGPDGEERLQTRVHHSQAGHFNQWEGIATKELVGWMLDQANLAGEASSEMEAAQPAKRVTSQPEAESASFLELSYPRVSEAEPAGSSQMQATHLHLESSLTVSGSRVDRLCEDRRPYWVEVHLVDTDTNRSERVASYKAQLSPGEQVYAIQQDFPIPQAGRYQLYLVASLLAKEGSVVYLQGPVVRVKP